MGATLRRSFATWIAFACVARALAGQGESPPGTGSIEPVAVPGVPPNWRGHVVAGLGVDGRDGPVTPLATMALTRYRALGNPAVGFASIGGEAYAAVIGGRLDGGVRLATVLPMLRVGAGLDLSFGEGSLRPFLTYADPLRRGGIFGHGELLRLDWTPGRGAASATIAIPIGDAMAGRTRPRRTTVSASPVRDGNGGGSRARVAAGPVPGALRLAALDVLDRVLPLAPVRDPWDAGAADSAVADRLVGRAEAPGYHVLLQEFLGGAAGDSGPAVVDSARRILLGAVLLRHARELGRPRAPTLLPRLGEQAARRYGTVLERTSLTPERRAEAQAAFRGVLALLQELQDTALARWRVPRLVWLPLQLALRPEEHDEQSELDMLLEAVMDQPILPGHDIVYATDERFHERLRRSIAATQRYHVLWIHEIAGRIDGRTDSLTEAVAAAYLTRLTAGAREFDATGRLPRFFILLDAYYLERSGARPWLEFLADPLGREPRLGRDPGAAEGRMRALRDSLAAAVAASSGLQALARTRGGEWLRGVVRVNVSVTNPSDPSFQSEVRVDGGVMHLADDVMRDHRKIVFTDLTESDPSLGGAMITGMGVGEKYARFRWLDRTLLLRGPSGIRLKEAARELLRQHGVAPSALPPELEPDPPQADYGERLGALAAQGWHARAALTMNETGYGPKRATVVKAILYGLMPPGSTLLATDPQWSGLLWASLLQGAALRGCRVLVIGPGLANAPFGAVFVQGELQRALFARLLAGRDIFAGVPGAGELRVGLFSEGLGTHNVPGGVRGVRDGLRKSPFLREAMPFGVEVWALFEQSDSLLSALGNHRKPDTDSTYHPRFHMKTQLLGTRAAMHELLGRPEWRAFFVRRIGERLRESEAGTDILLDHLRPLRPYIDGRAARERERQALYLLVGSHNQDMRSLALDGEALAVVAGAEAAIAAGDMLVLATVGVHWPADVPELDRLIRPVPRWQRKFAHKVADLF